MIAGTLMQRVGADALIGVLTVAAGAFLVAVWWEWRGDAARFSR
jgi:hypothetical protein